MMPSLDERAASGQVLPVTLEAILERSKAAGEPPWLTAMRAEHLMRFAEKAAGFGRYSRLKLNWRDLPIRPALIRELNPLRGQSATAHGGDGSFDFSSFSRQVARMDEASFRKMFDSEQPWDCLTLAAWSEGAALTWKNGGSDEAIRQIRFESQGGLVMEPLSLDVAPGADARLFLHWRGGELPALHLTAIGGRVGEGSRLKVFLLHEGAGVHHHLSFKTSLGKDSTVEVFNAWVGGKWTVARFCGDMGEPGAIWKESHAIVGTGKEHLDLDSQVRHRMHHTRSDVLVKTVASGSARAVFTGNILMEKEADHSEAYLADHVLLLSPQARADSIPGLEIKALDVKAAHAASVGQVDEEQLFYLESRGLAPDRARHLVVVGFLESLFGRVPFDIIPDLLDPILEDKVLT
jgi:Fe-S cluster assembly protein SufD